MWICYRGRLENSPSWTSVSDAIVHSYVYIVYFHHTRISFTQKIRTSMHGVSYDLFVHIRTCVRKYALSQKKSYDLCLHTFYHICVCSTLLLFGLKAAAQADVN